MEEDNRYSEDNKKKKMRMKYKTNIGIYKMH